MGPQRTQFLAHVLCRFLAGAACLSELGQRFAEPQMALLPGSLRRCPVGTGAGQGGCCEVGGRGVALPTCLFPLPYLEAPPGKGSINRGLALPGSGWCKDPMLPDPLESKGQRCPGTRSRSCSRAKAALEPARSPQSSLWPRGLPGPAHSFSPGVPFLTSFPIFSVYVTHAVRWAEFFPSGHLEGCQLACGRDALGSPTRASPGQSLLAPPTPAEFWAGQLRN